VTYPIQLFAEFERVVDTGGAEGIFQVDAGSGANRALHYVSAADACRMIVDATTTQANTSVSGATVGTTIKVAGRVASNDVQAAKNGTLATQDTLVTLPTTPTDMRVGAENGNTNFCFGYIRRVAVVSSAVSDAQLQSMTSG
jgi:hypothetical protein